MRRYRETKEIMRDAARTKHGRIFVLVYGTWWRITPNEFPKRIIRLYP